MPHSEKISSEKYLGPKWFLLHKDIWSKKILGSKISGPKFWSKKFGLQKNFGCENVCFKTIKIEWKVFGKQILIEKQLRFWSIKILNETKYLPHMPWKMLSQKI